MDHILQFEWSEPQPDKYFLRAEDLENCVTERILRNTFHDPLVSSSDDEDQPNVINWDEVFSKKQNDDKNHRLHIPGCRGVPKFPKLSTLTPIQHTQCLKVLSLENPHILPLKQLPRPSKVDYKAFEDLKPTYEKEQKEYQAWAKTLWASEHCIRALRPKPPVELVYEAQYKMRANELQMYPKSYKLAAQIPLESRDNECELIYVEDLITVHSLDLPQIQYESINDKINIVQPCAVPEPCNKHPCKFILPTENSVSILPLTEIERELAQYALEHGAQYIASESALRCLLALDQTWNITVSVCEVIGSDGDKSNVAVLGSEFAIKKESVLRRTYKAFRHLLEDALVPISEKAKVLIKRVKIADNNNMNVSPVNVEVNDLDPSSDDEENNLCIDTGEDLQVDENIESQNGEQDSNESRNIANGSVEEAVNDDFGGEIGFYECTCKETMFERPPPRSYKKWQVKSNSPAERHHVIVHCAHKCRGSNGEVVLEPIPEYQLELGASSLSKEKLASLALALHLRRNAALMNVRVDGASGEIVSMEKLFVSQFSSKYGDMLQHVAHVLHSALSQLQGLLPGRYILHHEPSHGTNALLYSPVKTTGGDTLSLNFELSPLLDESSALKAAPTISTELLPIHKFRRTLPCAFTPYQDQLAKPPRRPVTRSKTPPQALKWLRRAKHKKKKNQGN